jgi:calcium/calmodulin-dependent protein kinase I
MAARAFIKSFFKSGEAVEKYYKFGAKLGSGAFATVVVAKSRETKEKVAIKIIHKSGKTNVKLMEQEVEVLNNVHHPNCVSVREIFDTDKALYLVMDLCTGGELLAAISRKERFSEAQASAVVKDILLGLQYLHQNGIVHRDLKPENVLLESRAPDSTVKISDFGLSKLVQGKRQFLFSRCGTPAYVAPEVILAKPYDSKVDLWAVGVITFLIIAGHPPFYGETLDKLFDVIVRAEFAFYEKYWGHISSPCMHFVEQLLELDPAKRYSAEQALAHPWITGVMPKAPTLRSMAGLQAYSLARSRGITEGGDSESSSSSSSKFSSMRRAAGEAEATAAKSLNTRGGAIPMPEASRKRNIFMTNSMVKEDSSSSMISALVGSMQVS